MFLIIYNFSISVTLCEISFIFVCKFTYSPGSLLCDVPDISQGSAMKRPRYYKKCLVQTLKNIWHWLTIAFKHILLDLPHIAYKLSPVTI